jgi:glycosyltransferase involved in cell wall biosynthesis
MIDSVLAQTVEDWELIIVDGESNDGTRELIRDCGSTMGDRLVFIEEPNAGCCAARNTGIETARGSFVAFLDADDEFLPTKLERQLEFFERRAELALVYGDYLYIDEDGRVGQSVFDDLLPLARSVPFQEIAPNLRVCDPDLFHFLIRGYFIATIVGMVRREALDTDIRFIVDHPHAFAEWVFYLDIVRRFRAGYVNEPLCRHHFTNGSITRTSKWRNIVSHRRLLLLMLDRFGGISASARDAVRRQLADTCGELALQSYNRRDFAAAARYFGESCTYAWTPASVGRLVKSLHHQLSQGGLPGLCSALEATGETETAPTL